MTKLKLTIASMLSFALAAAQVHAALFTVPVAIDGENGPDVGADRFVGDTLPRRLPADRTRRRSIKPERYSMPM